MVETESFVRIRISSQKSEKVHAAETVSNEAVSTNHPGADIHIIQEHIVQKFVVTEYISYSIFFYQD